MWELGGHEVRELSAGIGGGMYELDTSKSVCGFGELDDDCSLDCSGKEG